MPIIKERWNFREVYSGDGKHWRLCKDKIYVWSEENPGKYPGVLFILTLLALVMASQMI